ncbi:MAG TPA: hypothetical protein VF832_09070 [Longimicrobiales bacterium]
MAMSATSHLVTSLALCAGLAGALATPAAGQRKHAPEVNGWNPPAIAIAEQIPSAAARADVRRQVAALIDVFRGAPTLAAPAFPIYSSVQASFVEPPTPYELVVRMVFYRPGMVGTAADDQVRIQVNNPSTLFDQERAQSAYTFGERELFLEPRFEKTWHGYPVNARDLIIVARADRPLFRPVSVSQYIALMTEDLKPKARGDESGTYAGMIQKVQGKLAELSPAQRAAPAYGCMDAVGDEDTYLCDASAPDARRLVEFNPAYWDRSLPRSAFQLLAIDRFNPERTEGLVGEALTAAWEKLDWSAFRHLLEGPARR